jgi:hypothetical protein
MFGDGINFTEISAEITQVAIVTPEIQTSMDARQG